MLNALTIDVEDYFNVEAFADRVPFHTWGSYHCRVERNVSRILQLLEDRSTRATFFVLGWIAERFPKLVRGIADAGHEVGCHSYGHQHISRQNPSEFREDIRRARRLLMDVIGRPVVTYRAPSFSITSTTLWALDVLVEEGFSVDSSIFPVRHDLYGIPDAERFPHWRTTSSGHAIFEFPPSTFRFRKSNFGVGGGGYLRLFPYSLTKWGIRRINAEGLPAMVYFHPWEIDPDQPRIRAGLRSRLRHYTNLSRMEGKIGRLMRDFQFGTLSEVCRGLSVFSTESAERNRQA